MGGRLPDAVCRRLHKAKVFEMFTFVVFTTCFAVNPDDRTTLIIHTSPWLLLQLGLVSLAVTNVTFARMSGYWEELKLPDSFYHSGIAYLVALFITTIFKISVTIEAFANRPGEGRSFARDHPDVAQVFDQLHFILIAIIPPAKAFYLLKTRPNLVDKITISWKGIETDSTASF